MSLNWNLKQIKDSDSLCWIDKGPAADGTPQHEMNPVTYSLIWATIAIGMGRITETNWRDFWARLAIVESLWGTFLTREDETGSHLRPITPEDVKAHIGLSTNAPNWSDKAWAKNMGPRLLSYKANLVATATEKAATGSA